MATLSDLERKPKYATIARISTTTMPATGATHLGMEDLFSSLLLGAASSESALSRDSVDESADVESDSVVLGGGEVNDVDGGVELGAGGCVDGVDVGF